MGYYYAKGGAAGAAHDAEVLSESSLVGYWRLRESAGSYAAEATDSAWTGTIVNGATFSQTGAMTRTVGTRFTRASSQRVNMGTNSLFNIIGAVTYECFYKPATFPTGSAVHTLMSKGYNGNTGCVLSLSESAGVLKLGIGSFSGSSFGTSWSVSGWSVGEWRHIIAGYTGTAWKIFVDGVEVASTTAGTGAVTSAAGFCLAALDAGGIQDHADGTLMRCAVYNAWIGTDRVAAHYAAYAADLSVESRRSIAYPTNTSTTRNNATAFVGHRFTVGAEDIVVTHLGRWHATGSSTAVIPLEIRNSAGTSVLATASIDLATATQGKYNYVALGSPLTLSAGQSYCVLSSETTGGPLWYEDQNVTLSEALTTPVSVNGAAAPAALTTVTAAKAYRSAVFKYTI